MPTSPNMPADVMQQRGVLDELALGRAEAVDRARVVEEAAEIRARAIVMPLPPRRTGASLFGRTLETVLTERPCRVIIDSSRARE